TQWPVTLARNMHAPRGTGTSPVQLEGMGEAPMPQDLAHFGNIGMRAWNHVYGDDLAHTAGGFSACIDGGANGRHVATESDGHQAAADLVLLDELDVGRLERCIAGLDGGDDAFGFDQSDCFTVCHKRSPACCGADFQSARAS